MAGHKTCISWQITSVIKKLYIRLITIMSHNNVTNYVSRKYFSCAYLMASVVQMSDKYFCRDKGACKHNKKILKDITYETLDLGWELRARSPGTFW